jgi:hypothetical protein
VPSTSRPAATRAASTAVTASAPRTVTPTARCDGCLGAAGARTERHSQTASPTPATAQVPFAVLEAFQLRRSLSPARAAHRGGSAWRAPNVGPVIGHDGRAHGRLGLRVTVVSDLYELS